MTALGEWRRCLLWLAAVFFWFDGSGCREAAGRDPSYAIYQKYRYAYDTYGYLLLHGEEGGETEAYVEKELELLPEESQVSAKLQDYDYLMKHYYSVHPSTTADRQIFRADQFLKTELGLVKNSDLPQILIYHTHSQETYADYGPGNKEATVLSVGAYLTQLLEEKGWNVIHDTGKYDIREGKLDRSKAYTYALERITGILQENPSIEVVLDIHRDGVQPGTRLVSQINGKPTAKIMFFQGLSRTPEGMIEYLPNPYLGDNLAFAFQMQYLADQKFPGYTRKIYLKGLRYNMHLRGRSSLIEVGAQTNTLEEAKNAMEPLAELLDTVLRGR